MNNKHLKLVSCALMATLFSTASCVDNDYDLTEDIDLTIQVGGSEFAIPGGETEPIKLSKILDIEENGIIKLDKDSNYYLLQEGAESNTKIFVDRFSVASPQIDPILIEPGIQLPTNSGSIPSGEKFSATLEQDRYNTSFGLVLPDDQGNSVPKELISASYIKADLTASLHFTLEQDITDAMWLDDIQIEFPRYFISADLNNKGVLTISGQKVSKAGGYHTSIRITAIDLNKLDETTEGTGIKDGKLDIKGIVKINGTVSVLSDDINVQHSSSRIELKAKITLGEMEVNTVTGVVKPDIDINIDPVTLSDLPDFLSDDQVRLDVLNPMVFFMANNQTPVKAMADGAITSWKKNEDGSEKQLGNPQEQPVVFHLELAKEKDQSFCLSPERPTNNGKAEWIEVKYLPTLITEIPDEFRFKIEAEASEESTEVRLNHEYFITTDYEVNVPFVFGDNLSIVYKDTVDGWNSDLKDYEIERIKATANVINQIPLGLKFTAVAMQLNANGESISLDDVSAVVKVKGDENGIIEAGTPESPKDTPIVIEITELKPGAVKKLDGLAFKATAASKGMSGQQLNAKQTLKLKNVRLKVPGGIKVDLN